MMSKLMLAALLSQFAAASDAQFKRQVTDEAAFSSAAAQLISLYIPPSVASAIASAAAAATVTGDPASIVQDALTATSPPPWLSAVPSEYAPNLSSLDSAVEALRGYASTGIDGASRIVTVTDEAGSTLITIVPGSVAVTGSSAEATATGTETDGTASSGATGSATTGSGAPTTSMTGEALSSLISSINSDLYASRTSDASAAASETTSSGFAAPTRIPMTAAGVVGFMGLVLAL